MLERENIYFRDVTGVGGKTAQMMAEKIARIALYRQVICITHLPQIAGKADSHLLAFKMDGAATTISSMRILSNEDRVNEIARMLSDETITESAKITARELLNFRN